MPSRLQLEHWWQKALAGAVGALANEVLRFYLVSIGKVAGPFLPPSTTPGQYLLASGFYCLWAAIITIAWDDSNPIKCVAVGAALPKIIQQLAESTVQTPKLSMLTGVASGVVQHGARVLGGLPLLSP